MMLALTEVESPPVRDALRRPTIIVLTEDSKPGRGGIAEGLHQLARALAVSHDVRIVTSVAGASAVPPEEGVRYEEVPWFRASARMRGDEHPVLRRLNTARWYAARPRRVRAQLAGILGGAAPDWLLVYRLSNVTYPWCTAARSLGLAYDVFAHGLELIEPASVWVRTSRRRALRQAGRVFANSRATAELAAAEGVPSGRLTVVRHGVLPERLVVDDPASRVLAAELTGGRSYILSVCTLVERKGIDLAIRAFAALAGSHPELDYVVVGVGRDEARLRTLATSLGVAPRVRFVGAVSDDVKYALYEGCRYFVLPNRRLPHDVEGFGIVFLEANHFGKAVVGGNNGGVPDAVEDGESGLLVDTTAGSAPLEAAMRRLLDDPGFARDLGLRGKARVARDFTWDRIARRLLESRTPAASTTIAARGERLRLVG